jgi:hypothetical protein
VIFLIYFQQLRDTRSWARQILWQSESLPDNALREMQLWDSARPKIATFVALLYSS